jgi:hypothetical protein
MAAGLIVNRLVIVPMLVRPLELWNDGQDYELATKLALHMGSQLVHAITQEQPLRIAVSEYGRLSPGCGNTLGSNHCRSDA